MLPVDTMMEPFFGLSNPGYTLTFTALLSWSPVESATFAVGVYEP